MPKQTLKIEGMHCASCAALITKKISALPNIKSVAVNYASDKANIDFDPSLVSVSDMNKEISKLGYKFIEEASKSPKKDLSLESDLSLKENATELDSDNLQEKNQFALPISLMVFALMMWDVLAKSFSFIPNLPIPMRVFDLILMLIASVFLFWVGRPYLVGLFRFMRFGSANMDTLVGIGTLTAYIYSLVITLVPSIATTYNLPSHSYFDATIVVIGFISFGKFLEARSKRKTGDAIAKLIGLQAKTALVIRDGKEMEIPSEEVIVGDHLIVKPGGMIAVDGEVTEGESYVDESMISGEPIPASKQQGDKVFAGTINTNSSFVFKATKIGAETMLAKIIKMVDEAQGSKAPIEALADKISSVFVPVVLGIAFTTLAIWLSVGSYYLGFSAAISFGILSFVSILVIACPCALGLATPTAVIVGVGKGALNGILIKDAATLETLHKVEVLVFDKTGTITVGKPSLSDIKNNSDLSDDDFISLLASLEAKSEHPIAHAVLNFAASKNIAQKNVEDFSVISGQGLRGKINGKEYFAGSLNFIKTLGLDFDVNNVEQFVVQGKTPVVLADKDSVLGFVMISDEIKDGAIEAVSSLRKIGVKTIMLTGDNKQAAEYIAKTVGLDEVFAELMPLDKLEKIKELQKENIFVAMAGDGINDAPALAQANVGIAMGSGTDVAIESAGITLLHGDISKVVQAIKLSKATMRTIKQNLFWAFIYNLIGIPLAAGLFYPLFGWLLSPVFAGLAMAFSSVSVVSNSLLLKRLKLR